MALTFRLEVQVTLFAASNPASKDGPFAMPETLRVAAIQSEPAWFDLDETVDKTVTAVAEAGANGAHVIGFPKTWMPGYPSLCGLAMRPIGKRSSYAVGPRQARLAARNIAASKKRPAKSVSECRWVSASGTATISSWA